MPPPKIINQLDRKNVGRILDLVDDKWREEKLPYEDVRVPIDHLPDPDADTGETNFTLREQERRWNDLNLTVFSDNNQFPDLGKKCQQEDCKQLDFLPVECSHCHLMFCAIHHPATSHVCSRFDNVVHEDELSIIEGVTCSLPKCSGKESIAILCPECNIHYCLAHRHVDLHACPKLNKQDENNEKEKWNAPCQKFKEAKCAVDKGLESQFRNARNKARAAKVQLLKLKSRAALNKQGLNIPIFERVHFLIKYPSKSVGETYSECVLVASSTWSLGRALDAAADVAHVPNTNNKPGTPQLRFFHEDRSSVVEGNAMHHILQDLLQQALLHDGQTLFLDYKK